MSTPTDFDWRSPYYFARAYQGRRAHIVTLDEDGAHALCRSTPKRWMEPQRYRLRFNWACRACVNVWEAGTPAGGR
jgi:hypothetical protein